jgi:hypothetical protein
MADKRGVAFSRLLGVERLGISGAFFCVVWGEGSEELEDTKALLHRR